MNGKKTAEILREKGKLYFNNPEVSSEERQEGFQMLLEATKMGDPEAMYIIAKLAFDGYVMVSQKDRLEYALGLMCNSANRGFVQARGFLNWYCNLRYRVSFGNQTLSPESGPLVDFDGKPISISRKGLLTPIDAVLEYKDGRNVLTISANVKFVYIDGISDMKKFEEAVIGGMMQWQGNYEVFGGQKVTVKINITTENRLFDNVVVIPVTSSFEKVMRKFSEGRRGASLKDLLTNKRSFATNGFKWTAKSRKKIFMQSRDGRFDNYDELMNVAKHEFGHTLGLGDLYKSETDGLPGVEKGTYSELDCYYVSDEIYNLVMCDHNGPISNNDIEMVILAFKENKMQLFQAKKLKDEISYALGRGN